MRTLREKRSNVENVDEVVAKVKTKRKEGERYRKWQLTENNPNYTKREAVERLTSIATAVYCLGCSEIGESGTSHIHAFVVFKNAIELGSLKRVFPRAHFEICRGSSQSNVDYIKKADPEPFEVGELPLVVVEEREDIPSEVVGIILECGLDPIEILKRFPRYTDYVVKNFRSLEEIYQRAIRRRY